LVVLTFYLLFYLLISNPFPSSFSAHHPSLYSHHHFLRAIDGPGKSPTCSRLSVWWSMLSKSEDCIAFRSCGRFTSVCSRQAHSTFQKSPKIIKLFLYTLYIGSNAAVFLF
jgi:hypothetical protein